MKPIVFVAHPVTGDIRDNLKRYRIVCAALSTAGHPLITWDHLVQAHLDGREPESVSHDWYMERTLPLVARADVVLAVNAAESRGAQIEIAEAKSLGIPVVKLNFDATKGAPSGSGLAVFLAMVLGLKFRKLEDK